MKKILITGLVLGFFTSAAFAVVNQPQQVKQQGFISVSATAQDEFAPNIAQVTFYVETRDKNLSLATNENKKNAQQAMDAVKKVISISNGDSIKTKTFNVNTLYTYSKDGKQSFDKYNIVNSFEVKIKNTSEIGKVINAALNNGATRVDGLKYSLNTDEAKCQELIAKASKMAKERAQSSANSLSVKLIGIKEVNTSCNSQNNFYPTYRVMNAKMSMDSAGAEADVPTEAGLIKIIANINAQFWVSP